MTPFQWKNCFADVQASKHDITILSYLNKVVLPALKTLNKQIDDLGRSEEPGDVFMQGDLMDMLRQTKLAFALSIQSIWERQLRSYLQGCAQELQPEEPLARKVGKADWKQLRSAFHLLRGIELEAFPSFYALDTLQHLGNACRHGDGESSIELSRRCPYFWQSMLPELKPSSILPVASMDLPIESLCEFAEAIACFWCDAGYIYKESIKRKHPHLEARLIHERAERKWIPQAPDISKTN